jgi:cytochrome c5
VPCPHCQRETPLKLDAAESAEVLSVGGAKWKLVAGALVASLVLVGALWAGAGWLKKKRESGTADVVASRPAAAAPARGGTSSATVQLDPPKAVTPVVAKFQNGFTAQQIRNGRDLFGGACTECHRQYDPATYNDTEWERTIGGMRGKAKLRGKQSDELDTFVRTVRN